MLGISKILLIIFLLCMQAVNATGIDIVNLETADLDSLEIPVQSPHNANNFYEYEYGYNNPNLTNFESEPDVFDSKFGKMFSNFIDNKVINNKVILLEKTLQ